MTNISFYRRRRGLDAEKKNMSAYHFFPSRHPLAGHSIKSVLDIHYCHPTHPCQLTSAHSFDPLPTHWSQLVFGPFVQQTSALNEYLNWQFVSKSNLEGLSSPNVHTRPPHHHLGDQMPGSYIPQGKSLDYLPDSSTTVFLMTSSPSQTSTSDPFARSNRQAADEVASTRVDHRSGSLLHAAADRILDQFREHSEPWIWTDEQCELLGIWDGCLMSYTRYPSPLRWRESRVTASTNDINLSTSPRYPAWRVFNVDDCTDPGTYPPRGRPTGAHGYYLYG